MRSQQQTHWQKKENLRREIQFLVPCRLNFVCISTLMWNYDYCARFFSTNRFSLDSFFSSLAHLFATLSCVSIYLHITKYIIICNGSDGSLTPSELNSSAKKVQAHCLICARSHHFCNSFYCELNWYSCQWFGLLCRAIHFKFQWAHWRAYRSLHNVFPLNIGRKTC